MIKKSSIFAAIRLFLICMIFGGIAALLRTGDHILWAGQLVDLLMGGISMIACIVIVNTGGNHDH